MQTVIFVENGGSVAMKIYRAGAGLLALHLAIAVPAFAADQTDQSSGKEQTMPGQQIPELHDFDFLVGEWRVHHRQLKERLAGSQEWREFEGTSVLWKTMGGYGTFDDNVLEHPGGTYRAMGVRAFDIKDRKWSIWWIDGRTPQAPLDPPVRGAFKDGVGTFYADDTFNGKPIRVRYTWSHITPKTCHWEQAFSPDGGVTWETNWRMDLERTK
jgi:hypothetical protein